MMNVGMTLMEQDEGQVDNSIDRKSSSMGSKFDAGFGIQNSVNAT